MAQTSLPRPGLRPITPADEDFLLEVYASARTDAALLDRLPAAEHLAFLQHQSQLQRAAMGIRYGSADYCVIPVEEVPIGRCPAEGRAVSEYGPEYGLYVTYGPLLLSLGVRAEVAERAPPVFGAPA